MFEKLFKRDTLDENLYTNFNDMIGYVGLLLLMEVFIG